MSDDAPISLRALEWFTEKPAIIPAHIEDWLMETDSMTQRLDGYCAQLTVTIRNERFLSPEALTDERAHLPVSERYWLREVVLYGDGRPWLFGRTLIPQQTLDGAGAALTKIGNVPLGRYLFQHDALTRDYIRIGCGESLWARRSRLCLSGHPLLLTELFLPEAPLYFSDSREG
ncbi:MULTISPECIES: chorismate lyase [unclassified Brenneria]|uniref:chorismate lyase n=1 Tax=unclassified Brenneria TaxID=2634434 RepID=UPI00155522FD|nr:MULTISPECIES: chorismate lyase [unclassified Brenneria]MBJ7222537.1 chorismate lyase [Brenneria sp. L3-3C-1]MEE3643780.1 chorismate lyase [Brenneria sp. L3_3C_1]MEE3651267.1 chorismate lyase [Brenneria sp. HEZEL_4_2_4]NPD01223.1 chorismate lyase [Brenneria sp. hezel4-2-4]